MKKIIYTLFAVVLLSSCEFKTPVVPVDPNTLDREEFELACLSNLDSTKVTAKMIADVIIDIEYIFDTEEKLQKLSDDFENLSYDERNLRSGSKEWKEWCKTRKMIDDISWEYAGLSNKYNALNEFFTPSFTRMIENRINKAQRVKWDAYSKYHTKFNVD